MIHDTSKDLHPASVAAARNVVRLRNDHGWSRKEVLRRLKQEGIDLPATSLRRIEEQEQRLRLEEAAALARIFGVSLDDLSASLDPDDQADRAARQAELDGRKIGYRLTELRDDLDGLRSELRAHQTTSRSQQALDWIEDCTARLAGIPEKLCDGPLHEERLECEAAEQAKLDEHQRHLVPPPEQSDATTPSYEPETWAEKQIELGVMGHGDEDLLENQPEYLRPDDFIQRKANEWLAKNSADR